MKPDAKIRRHPERSVPEAFSDVLERGLVAHVGFCQEGQPYVIPFTYHYERARPDRVYLHGSHASRTLNYLDTGAPVCVEVTHVHDIVYSRTALDHSMNYQSAVCFGRAHKIADSKKKAKIFEKMILKYIPGRKAGRDYEAPTAEHLEGTALLEVKVDVSSAKARRGGPNGPKDSDSSAPGTAGVLPVNSPV